MRRRRPPTPPGLLLPPSGGQDPPPLDHRNNGAAVRWGQSQVPTTTSMPAINIGTLFIVREGWEGDVGSGVATEDEDDTNAEAGGYTSDFLEVVLCRLWIGHFGRRRTTTKSAETSRDDEHEEDVVTRSMLEMLCKGEPSSLLSTAGPKR